MRACKNSQKSRRLRVVGTQVQECTTNKIIILREIPFIAPREKSLTVMVPPVCSSATRINFEVRTSIYLNSFLLLFSYITRTQMANVKSAWSCSDRKEFHSSCYRPTSSLMFPWLKKSGNLKTYNSKSSCFVNLSNMPKFPSFFHSDWPISPDYSLSILNRPYSYSQCWTGASLQWRLMLGNLFKCK